MDKVKQILEAQYKGRCKIIEYQSVKDHVTHKITQQEVTVNENIACRLSFERITNTAENTINNVTIQGAKLFCSPDIVIKAGSKIEVTQSNMTKAYKNSSVPAVYDTHQEIFLEEFKGWT